jgi:hypothetical protein
MFDVTPPDVLSELQMVMAVAGEGPAHWVSLPQVAE